MGPVILLIEIIMRRLVVGQLFVMRQLVLVFHKIGLILT